MRFPSFSSVRLVVPAMFVLGVILAAPSAYATLYEWLTETHAISIGQPECCHAGADMQVKWTVNMAGPYDEYRTAYFATTTSPTSTPATAAWQEWTSCRRHGTLSGQTFESCDVQAPIYAYWLEPTRYLWVRATTQYAGCGEWALEPDTTYCGDWQQAMYTLIH